jgi:hypothetical protein
MLNAAEYELALLRPLTERFPNVDAAMAEIARLCAVLTLPKGTIHVISDIHGEDKKLRHVINNASGTLRPGAWAALFPELELAACDRSLSRQRQAFALAHELAHLVLHADSGFASHGKHLLRLPLEQVSAARGLMSLDFFDKHPEYAWLGRHINERNSPDLFDRLTLAERMRIELVGLFDFMLLQAFSNGDAEQFVGRERNQRACHRQLVRDAVVSRRVNSNVRRLPCLTTRPLCRALDRRGI